VDANGQDIYQQPLMLYLCVTLNSLGTRHVTSANENRQFSSVVFPEKPSFLYDIVNVLKLSKGCTVNINEYWTYIAFKANVAVINNSPTNLEKEHF